MKINLKDYLVEGSTYEISLSKLTGLKVKDIQGMITREFGDPCFELTNIVFEDGSEMGCEGEHDLPYLISYYKRDIPNMDTVTMTSIYNQVNGLDEEEDDE